MGGTTASGRQIDQRLDVAPASDRDAVQRAARRWIETNVPGEWLAAAVANDVERLRAVRPLDEYRQWYVTFAASGMIVPTWPREYGGLGLPRELAKVVDKEIERARLPRLNFMGIGLAGPTILAWGDDEQKAELLWPTVANQKVWCQLFSEPGAGSDLAGLATRALRRGDDWVVTGQKVWTSWAMDADLGMLVTRTDPDVPKHQGLTYFVLDMHSPGVEVRPLRQITGDSEFNEVFLDEVPVPDRMRLGPVGAGWQVTRTTLMNERSALAGSGSGSGGRSIDRLLELATARDADGVRPVDDPWLAERIVDLWVESRVVRWTNQRARDIQRAGGQAGPEGSIGKLYHAEHNQRLQELALSLLDRRAAAHDECDEDARRLTYGFLRSRANTIEGGTSEIQRNIIGERLLGLPKEPGLPSDTPWSQIPRDGASTGVRP